MHSVREGINTTSSGSTDVYLPCFMNLHSHRQILLIMAAFTAQIGLACYQSAYSVCFYKWTGREKGFEHSDEEDRLIVIHASSNGLIELYEIFIIGNYCCNVASCI